jgi:hypothetical protein
MAVRFLQNGAFQPTDATLKVITCDCGGSSKTGAWTPAAKRRPSILKSLFPPHFWRRARLAGKTKSSFQTMI